MNRRFQTTLALTLFLATLAASPLHAQKSDAQIADDIAFAMGLAEDWGFVDLAGEVIQRIEDDGVTGKTQERLGLAKCDVFATGAYNESSLTRRNELFDEALAAYQEFIENNSRSGRLASAEAGYVKVSAAYALTLGMAQEDAVGEAAEALRLRRIEVLTDAVAKTGDLIDPMKGDDSAAGKRALVSMMLTRGRMLTALGRSQKDGQFAYSQAHNSLEEAAGTAGGGSPGELQAFELIGRNYVAQGMFEESTAFFDYVIDSAIPFDEDQWKKLIDDQELGQGAKDQRWLFVQLATAGLVDSYLAVGDVQAANRTALHFHNTLKREGFQISRGFGYEAYLAVARCLLDSGGWVGGNWSAGDAVWYADEEAAKAAGHSKRNRVPTTDRSLSIAQQVNRENKGNRMKVRAQRLIGRIIERPGVKVDPTVLYEAAEGVYNEQEYEVAIYAFKRLLRVLDGEDDATRAEFMPKTFFRMGRAYVRMGRDLEAAMAFREGCTTWQGDPEFDTANARGYFTLMKSLKSGSNDAPEFAALYVESETLAERFAKQSDQDEIKWNKAEKLRRNKDWDKAIAKYGEISPASNFYERALVQVGVCTYRKGDTAAGEELLRAYLHDFLSDPVKSAIGDSEIKAAMRHAARASAEFYYALALFKPLTAAVKKGQMISDEQWEEVLTRVGDYPDEFKDQDRIFPWTMYMQVTANLGLGKLEEARTVYASMLERCESSKFTALASVDIYKRLGALQAEASDQAAKDKFERDMATLLKANNALSAPNFAKLRNESRHWFKVADWAESERVLRRIQTNFAEGERAEDVVKFVLPDLAHALMQQQKVAEAHGILTELMSEGASNLPSRRTILNWVHAVSGWVEGDASRISVVPGVGSTDAEFDRVISKLNAMLNSADDKFDCISYGLRFDMAWTYYAWATAEGGPQKSDKKASSRRRLATLHDMPEVGEDFHGVAERCDTDETLAPLYGAGVLQARYTWLWKKVESAK